MSHTPRLLVVDDERAIRDGLRATFDDWGYDVLTADGISAARALLSEAHFDAVLLDIRLRDGDGLEFLRELRSRFPSLAVLIVTAYGDSARAISAMKLGAFEYLTKPFDLAALERALQRAVRVRTVARVERVATDERFVGASPAILQVWKAIGRASASDAPVLITGESGVGKELVARMIHDHSERRAGPLVAVNVAALAPTLVESELFGHERGAFTGALTRREGRFEAAEGGTLFLDEVADIDAALQTKLLRVLEDGGFERVGTNARLQSSARVIAATSRALDATPPPLREDLYYRLSVVRIEVPPLRQRRMDIPLLVDLCLQRRGDGRRAVSEEAMRWLVNQPWPGNVRQLFHVVERACVMSASEVLDVVDFGGDLAARSVDADPVEASQALGSLDLRERVEALERSLIGKALERANGNRTEAARLLGIRRALLYAKLQQYAIDADKSG